MNGDTSYFIIFLGVCLAGGIEIFTWAVFLVFLRHHEDDGFIYNTKLSQKFNNILVVCIYDLFYPMVNQKFCNILVVCIHGFFYNIMESEKLCNILAVRIYNFFSNTIMNQSF